MMPSCDFYALPDDVAEVVDFITSQPGWVLLESNSRPDQPLRHFGIAAAFLDAFDLTTEDAYLSLYSPSFGGALVEEHMDFSPGAVPGARGRTTARGWGLIQVYLLCPRNGQIRPSHTGHNSEARARRWESVYESLGPASAWNWHEVDRASRRLNQFIRGRATSRAGSRVILPRAAAAVASGIPLAANA
jgi:hypothetical protein